MRTQTSAPLPPSQEADAFAKADALKPLCASSPGSGDLPFPLPALERAIPFETRSRPAGHAPTLRQGGALRQALREHRAPTPAEGALSPSLPSRPERPKVRLWASLRKEVMPMVQLLRAVLANTLGRLLASLISKFLED